MQGNFTTTDGLKFNLLKIGRSCISAEAKTPRQMKPSSQAIEKRRGRGPKDIREHREHAAIQSISHLKAHVKKRVESYCSVAMVPRLRRI